MFVSRLIRAAFAAIILAATPLAAHAADITVFAAASLSDVLPLAAGAYKTQTGKSVAFSFASSAVLARQIEASGGADLFMSADTDWMDYLDNRGLIAHETRKNLLGNHLVLIAPADSKIVLTIAPHFDLLGALAGGRLSVADPDSVPAGKYARSALTTLGVWNSVVNHLVQAENVRVALAYVARGETPLGIVYTTDALSEAKVRIVGAFPDNSHAPIVYPAGLTKDGKPEAQAFLDFLSGPQAQAIFAKAGFILLSNGH